jgi:hypothetical protein
LEALRLEIEALRKSLQATRARVQALEDEVRTLKRGNSNPAGMKPKNIRPSTPTPPVDPTGNFAPPVAPAGTAPRDNPPATIAAPAIETRPQPVNNSEPSAASSPTSTAPRNNSAANDAAPTPETRAEPANNAPSIFTKPPKTATDSLAHAEKALKQLRANPNDTKAVEALERALKRLKEREKPNVPGETRP